MSDRDADLVTDYSVKADEEKIRRENERRTNATADNVKIEGNKLVFQLSEKERAIVERLNKRRAKA